ncbi:MAG TPA: HAMP domain-containing sensor histidine kinase [Acidimicrobiia bacterium]|nr:HAMP domain-containing sensor histidine kinase [Acidimicrobiia bacterium]
MAAPSRNNRRLSSRRPRRLRLRSRLLVAFAGGALLISAAVALLSYALTRHYLITQRQTSAQRQAEVNARLVGRALRSASDVPQLLASLQSPAASNTVVLHSGGWFASSLDLGRDALPEPLQRAVVERRERARQHYVLDHVPRLAVGLPLPDSDAYFEVFPLRDLDRTLRTLRVALAVAAGASMVGAAGLAVWGSRRLLDPLAEIGAIATTIADGQLDARLDVGSEIEVDALATSFNRMVAGLQERIERDARFASNVSHELRSPLTALRSAVQNMQTRRATMDERTARSLDVLEGEVSRFEHLVQDLLEISRFDAGIVRGSFEEVFLGELVLHAVEAMPGGPIPVEVAASAGGAVVEADKRRLEQVLVNLVSNARVHGGGVERVRIEAVDGRARVVVEDCGPGVPAEDRERIFERFQRGTHTVRTAGGVGLGLALVSEHIRMHRGRVWVEDRPGGGACFVIELPVVPA